MGFHIYLVGALIIGLAIALIGFIITQNVLQENFEKNFGFERYTGVPLGPGKAGYVAVRPTGSLKKCKQNSNKFR